MESPERADGGREGGSEGVPRQRDALQPNERQAGRTEETQALPLGRMLV